MKFNLVEPFLTPFHDVGVYLVLVGEVEKRFYICQTDKFTMTL